MIRYPVARPSLGAREREYLLNAFDSGWVSSQGHYVDRVTHEFPRAVGATAGVPCASGTAALHLAMLALGVGPGDEVIVPDLTYVATANAPLFVGASSVLADVRERDWSLDVSALAALVTPRTRGVIAVHLFGIVGDLGPLRVFCDAHGLWLVEDCVQVLGAPLGERRPGRWGELSTWSFYGSKVLTSGEGGFVTTEDRPDMLAAADAYRTQAVVPGAHYVHAHVGFNYRLTNLQCALLCAQLESLDAFRHARAAIGAAYDAALAVAREEGLLAPSPHADVCWLYAAVLDDARRGGARDDVARVLLERHGIDTRPFPRPMHELPHFSTARTGRLTVAPRLARTGLSLPTYVGLERSDVDVIAAALVAALRAAG
jgi:perosamine synthetase